MDEITNVSIDPVQPPQSPVPPPEPQEHPEAVPTARRTYSRSMLNLALYAVISEVLITVITIILNVTGHPVDGLQNAVYYLIHFGIMYLIAFPIYLLLSKPIETSAPPRHKLGFGQWLLCFMMSEGMAVTGALVGAVVTFFLSALFHIETGTDFLQNGFSSEGYGVFTVVAALGAPIVEEMLFRKVLIDRIRKYGEGTAIIISGLLFGLFHGNFTQFFYAAMLGMFFAYIYLRTGNILNTIFLHMSINSLSSLVAGTLLRNIGAENLEALTSGNTAEVMKLLPKLIPFLLYDVVIYSIAIAGVIILIVNRKKFHLEPPEVRLPKEQHFKTAFMNLGFWAMVLFCMALFVISALQSS